MNKSRFLSLLPLILGIVAAVALIVGGAFTLITIQNRKAAIEAAANTTAAPTTTTVAPTTQTTLPPGPPEDRTPGVEYFVPYTEKADPSYFSDVVFVGDSVTQKLMFYDMQNGALSNADWVCSSSLGLGNSMWDLNNPNAVHPMYQGQIVSVPDGIAMSGRSKVYMMLGVNDLPWNNVEEAMESFKILTDRILAFAPDVTMYIQSVTPLYADDGDLTNQRVNEYNAAVSEYCREKGWYFIDVASVMRDENGCLPLEYCSDANVMGIHFTDVACDVWIDYLYTHTVK